MKHFVIELTYTGTLEAIDAALVEHRAFLQTGYDKGLFLCSGPQTPRTGGIIVGRAASKEEIEAFLKDDPFARQSLASYRFTEFTPVKHQDFLKDWVSGS